jgi:mRNA interferase RelE/StbE
MNETTTWTVKYHRDIEKEIRKLPKKFILRVLTAIESLAENPRPRGSQKIEGHDLWKIRVGDYRILYQIDHNQRIINTYRVGHRRDVAICNISSPYCFNFG